MMMHIEVHPDFSLKTLMKFIPVFAILLITCQPKTLQQNEDGILIGEIIDADTGQPVPARVYVIGANDSIYMAEECLEFDIPWMRKTIGHTGRHFTTIGNKFKVKLPVGNTAIRIERGKEYITLVKNIQINSGETVTEQFKIHRWIDMNNKGWYSGEHHIHRPLNDLIDLKEILYAEDLNIGVALTNWNEKESLLKQARSVIDRSDNTGNLQVDKNHTIYSLAHEIEGHPGAVFYHLMDKQQFPLKLKGQKHRSKMYIDLSNQVKKNGGYVEIEKPIMTESFVQAALSEVDFMGIANNHMLYDKYLPEGKRITRTDLKIDYPIGEKGYCLFTFDLYYMYLNSGFKIMPTAGSASHPIANPVGYNRIYAQLDGEMNSTNWFKTVKSGNSFVTNGPMLILTANDKPMGSTVTVENNVALNFTIYSHTPIENVQLIENGIVIKDFNQLKLNNNEAHFDFNLKIDKSSWIAARCFEKQTDGNVRFAHTSPIFIHVKDKPFRLNDEALNWFILQTNQLILKAEENNDMDKTEKEEAIELYGHAIGVFNEKIQQKYIQF